MDGALVKLYGLNVWNNYVRPNSGFVEKLNAYFMHIRAFSMTNVVPGPWVCSF